VEKRITLVGELDNIKTVLLNLALLPGAQINLQDFAVSTTSTVKINGLIFQYHNQGRYDAMRILRADMVFLCCALGTSIESEMVTYAFMHKNNIELQYFSYKTLPLLIAILTADLSVPDPGIIARTLASTKQISLHSAHIVSGVQRTFNDCMIACAQILNLPFPPQGWRARQGLPGYDQHGIGNDDL
jgi:hypothetical protein